MVIISYLNAALAVSGLQVLHLLGLGFEGGAGLLGEVETPTSSPRKGSASPMKEDRRFDDEPEEGKVALWTSFVAFFLPSSLSRIESAARSIGSPIGGLRHRLAPS